MAKGTIEKRPLTDEEIADAARLKSAWELFAKDHKERTQGWLAQQTGLGNQSLMSGYMNGHIQLNPKAVLEFARVLNIHPSAISPRMSFPDPADDPTLSADAVIELILLYRQSTATARDRILRFARSADKAPSQLKTALLNNQT